MKTTIMTLYQKGYNKTQIGKMLGIDRKTVRKVLREEAQGKELPQETQERTWPSMLDEYKEYIEIQLSKELSITRIHQDLQKEFGVACGYTTLRDYVKKIRKSQPHAYMVLHSLPGEEAQVDFGYIGTLRVNGTPRKAWIFVMSLSYSRYMYVAVTLDQSVQTFIRCHTEAFRYFGGVPQTVKIDNLKAAIVEADFYEPTVQRTYAAFAEHYGFLPNPCRVYTPTDKGKVESNVKYVKENCFKGRDFKEIEEAKRFLLSWLKETANRRIHGTTSRKPETVYLETEKAYGKNDRNYRQLRHIIISPDPQWGLGVDTVYRMAYDIAKFYGNRYQICFGVHSDTDHVHIHLVQNTLSYIQLSPDFPLRNVS